MYYCSMFPLLIQVYKWAPLAYGKGKTLQWTDIPFRVGGGGKKHWLMCTFVVKSLRWDH